MFTYSFINLIVTLAVLGAGLVGFAGGWMAHRAAVRERAEADGAHDPYNV
ncbi:MAG: hypothetical protein MRY74_00270 [Neomegalonema sp.]|nr:hypothetical protein [Neomegalonema sp.]